MAATAYSAAILDRTDHTLKETLIASNRAWIAVLGIDVEGSIVEGQEIQIKIIYSNVGKSPAMIARAFNFNTSDHKDSLSTSYFLGPNKACEGLVVPETGEIIFGGDSKDHWIITRIPARLVNKSVFSGDKGFATERLL